MTEEEKKNKKREYMKAWKAANAKKIRDYEKAYRQANADKLRERKKRYDTEYRQANDEKIKARRRQHYITNFEKISEKNRKYYKTNSEKVKINTKKWKNNNPELHYVQSTKQRAFKLNRLHPDHDKEKEIVLYILSKNLEAIFNEPFDIDHILPYDCGGWHHHENLQVIPARINRTKQNNPDYECNWPGYKTWKDLPDYLLIDKK